MNRYEVIANKIASTGKKQGAAGPYTLLEQLRDDLQRGRLQDDSYLKLVGYGWGHTPGVDYAFGQAAEDIAFALIGFDSGHKTKEEVLRTIQRNIRQALVDNEPFRGLRGEQKETRDLWFKLMKEKRRGV